MITIDRAGVNDVDLLSHMGKETFIAAHWHSAPMSILIEYADQKYDPQVLANEVSDASIIYHLVYKHGQVAGYSKLILNSKAPNGDLNTTQLDRLYLLKDYFKQGIGEQLLTHNIDFSKAERQLGMWLNVWTKNMRAIDFYKKHGFEPFRKVNFKITETHYNDALQMILSY